MQQLFLGGAPTFLFRPNLGMLLINTQFWAVNGKGFWIQSKTISDVEVAVLGAAFETIIRLSYIEL